MPEGLSPIEAGKKLHEHTTEPHQPATSERGSRHSRMVQVGEALLLSLVTIAAAWSGYAAAKWGTESRFELAQAATLRNLATRADLSALSTRNFDSSTFNAWFTAFTWTIPRSRPSPSGASGRSSRWPSTPGWPPIPPQPRAPPGPTTCPSTGSPIRPRPRRWTGRPWRRRRATMRGWWVTTIRITVFLAAVLFLVGIGSTFKLHTIRYVLITIGSLLLILATVLILQQGLPG